MQIAYALDKLVDRPITDEQYAEYLAAEMLGSSVKMGAAAGTRVDRQKEATSTRVEGEKEATDTRVQKEAAAAARET